MNSKSLMGTSALLLLFCGCSEHADVQSTLTLATTTSTRDSGLLDALLPIFEEETGIDVKVIAVGSGQALALGRRGDADVLLTHAPEAEREFVSAGYGEARLSVMHNDFVLVGPKADPAHVEQAASAAEAFRRIADTASAFVSRGDDSGTHRKEQSLWKAANVTPEGQWYIQAGSGMAATLRMADQKQAYALADRGTFLAQRETLDLMVRFEGDPLLQNYYAAIVVSEKKHPHVHHAAARRFAAFLRSRRVQRMIGKYGIDRFGQPLFVPSDFADVMGRESTTRSTDTGEAARLPLRHNAPPAPPAMRSPRPKAM